MFGLSGTGDGSTSKNKTLMNSIAHGTNHPVSVHDIFDCYVHMEEGNTKNSKFIGDFMKGMMNELYPRKELFYLINFNGDKVVQVKVDIIEKYCPNISSMLCTLIGGNTCFSDIGNVKFVKNVVRGSKLVH